MSPVLPRRRTGFTLVEVALAVAVGLIVIGGAVLSYYAVHDAACNVTAHDRVLGGQVVVEEFASANFGAYPTSGSATFVALWRAKRASDYNLSPWGGVTVANGAIERVPYVGGASASTAVSLSTATGGFAEGSATPPMAGMMLYTSLIGPTWAKATRYDTGNVETMRNYGVYIFDKNGQPYWDVKGGR